MSKFKPTKREFRIHAKASGLMSAVELLSETDKEYKIHAVDEKRSKKISKTDPKNKLFLTVDEAMKWILDLPENQGKKKGKSNANP